MEALKSDSQKPFEIKRLDDSEFSQTFLWARSTIESGEEMKAAALIEELDLTEINNVGRDGMTLLCSAIRNGLDLVVSVLIERGADANAKCSDGQLPLMAALRSKRENLVLLLLASGADPALREEKDHDSAARLAARFVLPNALSALLEAGTDLMERDENGNRLLDYAHRFSSPQVSQLIEAYYPKTDLILKAEKRLDDCKQKLLENSLGNPSC